MVEERNIEVAGDYDILCESCQHQEVCGFEANMHDVIKKLNGIKVGYQKQPFAFEVHCRHYTDLKESK